MMSKQQQQHKNSVRKMKYNEIGQSLEDIKKSLSVSSFYDKKVSHNDSLLCMLIEIKNLMYLNHVTVETVPPHLPSVNASSSLNGFTVVFQVDDGSILHISENVFSYFQIKPYEIMLANETIYEAVDKSDGENIREMMSNQMSHRVESFFVNFTATKRKSKKKMNNVIKMEGHFTESRELFIARCTPLLTPKNRKELISSSPFCFTSIHSTDLNFKDACYRFQNLLGYTQADLSSKSLLEIVHSESLLEILALQQKQQDSFVISAKVMQNTGSLLDCLMNVYCKNISGQEFIVCHYQVFKQREMTDLIEYFNKNPLSFQSLYRFNKTQAVYLASYSNETPKPCIPSTKNFIKHAKSVQPHNVFSCSTFDNVASFSSDIDSILLEATASHDFTLSEVNNNALTEIYCLLPL